MSLKRLADDLKERRLMLEMERDRVIPLVGEYVYSEKERDEFDEEIAAINACLEGYRNLGII